MSILITARGSSSGDMTKAVYDPTNVNGDAFDQDNMVDGATNKNYTTTEQTKLSGIETAADVTDETNVIAALNGATIASATIATGDKVIFQDINDSNNLKVATAQSIADLATKPFYMTVAVSDETTDLTTGAAKITFRMPVAVTLTSVRASTNVAPVGSTIIVDINEGGASILSTKLTIDAGEKTSTTAATPPVISDSALADDAEMTIDIDQIGSGTPGKGLKVTLIGTSA